MKRGSANTAGTSELAGKGAEGAGSSRKPRTEEPEPLEADSEQEAHTLPDIRT